MRKLFLLLILHFSFSAFSQKEKPTHIDSILNFAKKQMGIRYHYAHCTPKEGFDCSGFVYYVFNHFNIKVPRASLDYEKMGKLIPADSAKPGDIIVFTGTNYKNKFPGHVGIILSQPCENITFIHSSSSKKKSGVKISSFADSPGYKIRFIKIARLSEEFLK